MIDHENAMRQKMTEQYLLGELDPVARDEFEEHYFSCAECAKDVRAGTLFVDHSKMVLADPAELVAGVRPIPPPSPSWWLRWLSPALTAPLLALSFGVVGYQTFVVYPRLLQPQVVAVARIDLDSFSGDDKPVVVTQGSGLVLQVRVPPENVYSSNTVELQNPAGKIEGPVTLPTVDGQALCAVQFPAISRQAGTYTLIVRGAKPNGESKEVTRKSFELRIL